MGPLWAQLAGKFDALSLRERVLVTCGVLAVTVYMSYFLLIAPLVTAKPRIEQKIAQDRTMLKAVEAIIAPRHGQAEGEAVKRAYRDALLAQTAALDASLQGMQKGLVPPDEMASLLKGVLGGVRGVELVSLRKLAAVRVTSAKAEAASEPAGAGAPKRVAEEPRPERSVYRHAFKITIEGSYAALLDYLARLEKLPWRISWGGVNVDAKDHPRIRMTLTVSTMSLARAWLTL
jgi:MSHA biogenesis protein MshJ